MSKLRLDFMKIFSDTWVEGGYVRAKVIKPDIGVSNGLVHQIDAVFGKHTVAACADKMKLKEFNHVAKKEFAISCLS